MAFSGGVFSKLLGLVPSYACCFCARLAPALFAAKVRVFFSERMSAFVMSSHFAPFFRSFNRSFLHSFVSGYLPRSVLSAVASVFSMRYPPAIARLVVSIVINAVNFVSLWTLSHVSNKVTKRNSPPITHRYAPSSISVISLIVAVVAPLFHRAPNSIEGMRFISILNFGGHTNVI